VHFLEGQKLIHDLVLLHPMQGSGFAYFRDTFLGLLPIVFFLKPGESLGIYLDCEDPYFRLKIETNSAGHTRTLLLPEDFNEFPMRLSGQVRVTKIFPSGKLPYTSMIELKEVPSKDVINRIFAETYQTDTEVLVSEASDQSVMVTKLPPMNSRLQGQDSVSRQQFMAAHRPFLLDVFAQALTDIEAIVKRFEDQGFSYLGSRQIDFFCPCSQERMVMNLRGLYAADLDSLFSDQNEIEIACDYCRKRYVITRSDVSGS
jgi:molecular chaperone Hsp33